MPFERQHSLLDERGMRIITIRGIGRIHGECFNCDKEDVPLQRNTDGQYCCAACIRRDNKKRQDNIRQRGEVRGTLERQDKGFSTREEAVRGKDTHGTKKPMEPSSSKTLYKKSKQSLVHEPTPPAKTVEQLKVEDLCKRGDVLLDLRCYEEALKVFQEAIQLNPKHALAHQGASFAWQHLGDEEMALGERMKAVKFGL